MNTVLMTVTFKVPDSAKDQINTAREFLSDHFILKEFSPDLHITIYQCKIPDNSVEEAYNILKNIAEQVKEVSLEAKGLNIKNEYVGIAYKKSETISQIHQDIIEGLNKLRGDLVRSTYLEKRNLYNEQEQKYIDMYGYPYVFDEYHPHIALATLQDKNDNVRLDEKDLPMVSFNSYGFEVIILKDKKSFKAVPFGEK